MALSFSIFIILLAFIFYLGICLYFFGLETSKIAAHVLVIPNSHKLHIPLSMIPSPLISVDHCLPAASFPLEPLFVFDSLISLYTAPNYHLTFRWGKTWSRLMSEKGRVKRNWVVRPLFNLSSHSISFVGPRGIHAWILCLI